MDRDSFWLICDDTKQNCHCDWRVTIVDCIERQPMLYIYVINAIWSLIICIIGSGLLYHRVIYKKLPLFDYKSSYGIVIRPKPIESMIFFGLIFNALRIIDTILLVTGTAKNPVFRAFLYELPWQFGLCAFACYLFGIAHTVSNSSKIFGAIPVKIDIFCFIMIALPFFTNNVCSIAAAVYADKGDRVKAKIFTDALYYLWTIYCFTLACWILISGLKLIYLLERHLNTQKEEDPNSILVHKIRNGLFKVRMVMSISITSLFIFSFVKCAYGVLRVTLLQNNALNLAVAVIWTYDGTLASMLVVITVLFNPKALSSFSLSSSSHNTLHYYRSATKSNSIMHNQTDSHVIDNDGCKFTFMTETDTELKQSYHHKYDHDVENISYYYYYNQEPRQSEDIHMNTQSNVHLVSQQ